MPTKKRQKVFLNRVMISADPSYRPLLLLARLLGNGAGISRGSGILVYFLNLIFWTDFFFGQFCQGWGIWGITI